MTLPAAPLLAHHYCYSYPHDYQQHHFCAHDYCYHPSPTTICCIVSACSYPSNLFPSAGETCRMCQ